MVYQDTIDYLFNLQKHGIKLGMSNSFALMELMGNPHTRFRSVHIAGTNGKGSTAAFLTAMLRAAGYRVGLYTSPHLVSFTERIRIDGLAISEQDVVELADRVRTAYGQTAGPDGQMLNPTFFEVTTAVAFTYFAEQGVDLVVVETGMGGRLDSTNVVAPLVSVITNIDLEHTEFLGDTIELIAAEKAGIIKRGVPVVTGAVQPGAVGVIEKTAAALGSRVLLMGRDFGPERVSSSPLRSFDYRGIAVSHKGLGVNMLGAHQAGNASLALAAVEGLREQGFRISETSARRGLYDAAWEGRLERVARRPDIILDGAHNPASAATLARALREMMPSYRRLILVIGILADKDFRGIVSELAPLADHVVVTRPQYSRAMDIGSLAAEMRKIHDSVDAAGTLAQAMEKAGVAASEDDLIVITGSLYTVGDARALFFHQAGQSAASLKGLKG